MSDDELKVDVGVLKTQVLTLTTLCGKMDNVIEKLVDQHDRHLSKVYTDMDNRRLENEGDIKEIHERIDTVLDKMQVSELRIMSEIKDLRACMLKHNADEKKSLEQLLRWKWMVVGGVLVLSLMISHIDLKNLINFIK